MYNVGDSTWGVDVHRGIDVQQGIDVKCGVNVQRGVSTYTLEEKATAGYANP